MKYRSSKAPIFPPRSPVRGSTARCFAAPRLAFISTKRLGHKKNRRSSWCRIDLVAFVFLTAALLSGTARADQVPAPGEKTEIGKSKVPVRGTLYSFFATWCVPCRVELPHIQRLHEEYAAKGLRVVLVSEDAPSSAQQIPSFLARYGVTAEWILDDESELLERYNQSANVPFTALVDAQGKLIYGHAGFEPGDEKLIESSVVRMLDAATQRYIDAAKSAAKTNADTSGTSGSAPDGGGEVAADKHAKNAKPWVRLVSNSQGLGVWRTSRFEDTNADGDIDERLSAAVARIELAGYTDRYSASVRIDGAILDEELVGPGDTMDARPERMRIEGTFGPVTVLAGDDYVQFGHGVSLSLRRLDPLGLDTTVQGGRINVKQDGFGLTALAGQTNPQNLDPIELSIVSDIRDTIAGSEVAYNFGKKGGAGSAVEGDVTAYGLIVRADKASATGTDIDWIVGGASTSMNVGAVRIAAEGAAGRRDGVNLMQTDPMWAGYGSIQWQHGRITTLLEGKAYRRWEIGRANRALLYNEAPTLERDDQEVPANADAVGGRGRVEVRLPYKLSVFGNALAYRFADDGSSPLDGDIATHGFVGADKRFDNGGAIALQAGYRDENRADGGDRLSLWHVDFDLAMPIAHRYSMTFKLNHRSETKDLSPLPNNLSWVRGLAVGTLALSGVGAFSLLYGYSTEEATTPTSYPAAELLVHLPRGGQARLFVGSLTGGRVCVSGSCRDVPAFKGGRLDLIIRM